jgi:hypothetical protein
VVKKDRKPHKPPSTEESKQLLRHTVESMGSRTPTIRKDSPFPAIAQTPPGINHERITDLRHFFNISFVFTLQKSLWIFILIFMAWAGYLVAFGLQDIKIPLASEYTVSLLTLLRLMTLLPLIVVGYWELYRGTIELRIEGFRIIMTSGVFLKLYDSRAICSVSSLAVMQTNWDKFLNVFHVEFRSGPTPPEIGPLTVPALTEADALKMEQYLSTQLSRLSSPSSDALADDERIKMPLKEDFQDAEDR